MEQRRFARRWQRLFSHTYFYRELKWIVCSVPNWGIHSGTFSWSMNFPLNSGWARLCPMRDANELHVFIELWQQIPKHKILPLLLSMLLFATHFIAKNANEYRICTAWIAYKQTHIYLYMKMRRYAVWILLLFPFIMRGVIWIWKDFFCGLRAWKL